MKKENCKKRKHKILRFIGASILCIICALLFSAVVNKIINLSMNKYIDSFSSIDFESQLKPAKDENGIYYFVTDGEFKVMQITDIHLGGGFLSVGKDKKAMNSIAAMINEEKPDLVIVTGDISFAVPYISGTTNNKYAHSMFKRFMENLGVYWTVALGNHDSESYNYYDRESVRKMYTDENLEYCLFSSYGELSGEGNHSINVKNSKGFITETFYMIDTHSYTEEDPLGVKWDYDCIKEDQINWYKNTVEANNAYNESIYNTLAEEEKDTYAELLAPKSLMFMHIPLKEVKYAYDEFIANNRENTENVEYIRGTDGETDEVVFSSKIDENLFETIQELGSTKALFYGHDHLNNFVFNYKGIILCYGYSTDYLAYWQIDKKGAQRGCTMITCGKNGTAEITHENYYQDKYQPLYDKEIVTMEE